MSGTAETTRLILASSSPRRRELMLGAGYAFEVVDPPLPEPQASAPAVVTPIRQAEASAYFKARAVADREPASAVLGADTIVVVNGEILGKPADRADAERMLRALSGTRHRVITGVALLEPDGRRRITSAVTYVTMRRMTEREIAEYLDSGEWIGKAGAYAIQETADRFVVKVEGSWSNVVGLPMETVGRLLAEQD